MSNALTFSANAYFRYIGADTVNPNLNTNSLDESVYQPSAADQAALKAAGYTGYPTSGGQPFDTGILTSASAEPQTVRITQVEEDEQGRILHFKLLAHAFHNLR